MLEYDKVSKGIDVNKTEGLRECIICYYCYLLNINSRFQSKICNGHDIDVVTFFC